MATVPPAEMKHGFKAWLEHWRDESDAAYLYRVLADQEKDPKKKQIYLRLAGVEDRHVEMWSELLNRNGVAVSGGSSPSFRARALARLGRILGAKYLLPLLLAEEGREVKAYLSLSNDSQIQEAKDAALTLAQESALHAQTLAELTGSDGEPWHRMASGGHLRSVVYGFNDGLTANFGLVAGVLGANVGTNIVLVSGIAGMISDALSMGSSGYLAAKSQQEFFQHEVDVEREEIRLMPQVEEEELALIYEAKGVSRERARRTAAEVMKDHEQGLAEKVREELKIGEAHSTPRVEGAVTGVATAVGALIPLFPFILVEGDLAIYLSFTISMLSHFAVGAARSFFTGRGTLRSGIDMLAVGLGVAAVAYWIGDRVSRWLS